MDVHEHLSDWISEAGAALDQVELRARVDHVGRVSYVGDSVAGVEGLPETRLGELLRFDDGTLGLALSIDKRGVQCVLLGSGEGIVAGVNVHGTGQVARVPVGEGLLGRIVDALGRPLDGRRPIETSLFHPVERPAPGIVDRELITEPLLTGVTVVDAMIPLGRGQRALLMGDRKTGKTALAVDTVINQRDTDVVCVYALIGQKTSTVEQVVDSVHRHGRIENCIFVVGEASASPGEQWLVPYAACTMAEYYRDIGRHALVIFDDLTKHAIVYRQISLLLKRPPGREAYPADVFYIHSRLLERAAKLSNAQGGGSLTALPIVETQAGNLSAFIPTNLISITDGQIYFEPKLFYEGQKPAVNVGLSVSRVGGKTQPPILKAAASRLKLDYAQFAELEVFTRFGALVDERTRRRIEHGRRVRAILAQPQFAPRALALQAALLMAAKEGKLDALDVETIPRFVERLESWLLQSQEQLVSRIERDKDLDVHGKETLIAGIEEIAGQLAQDSQT